jgi:cytochrome c-type biogenesis protein CcmH/NrfG
VKAKWVAVGLSLVVLFYLVTLGQRGWVLVTSGEPGGVALGVGVLLLPVVVAWAVWRELRFGLATQKMARQLTGEGGMPVDDLPRTPAGRVDREAADASFARFREQTEAAPQDWRSWFRLACAYDVAGDRRRARAAMRHATRLFS